MASVRYNDEPRSVVSETVDNRKLARGGKKKNYGLLPKILSVFAAFILWLYVFQAVEVEKQFKDIPITVENFDTSLELDISGGFDHTVDVTVTGTNSEINAITAEDIRAVAPPKEELVFFS